MMKTLTMSRAVVLLALAGCGEDPPVAPPPEVITTVILDITPSGGGFGFTVEFDDPDGDGGDPPVVDPIALEAGTSYTIAVRFENRLEAPPEDITQEIRDEGDEHLVLFTGTAVVGPASPTTAGPITHAYADSDANGLPLGLANTFAASSGTGTLTLTLRHMPPEEPPGKAADTLETVRTSGIDAIGGSTDARVDFMVTVP